MPPLRYGICTIVAACLWHAGYYIARSAATIEEYSVTKWRSDGSRRPQWGMKAGVVAMSHRA